MSEACGMSADNTGVFRDVKEVLSRTVLTEQDGYKVVEIEQLGEVRIMWHQVQFKTKLTVTEDGRDPDNLTTIFELISSVRPSLSECHSTRQHIPEAVWHQDKKREQANSLGSMSFLAQQSPA